MYLHHLAHHFGIHNAFGVLLEVHAPFAQRVVDPALLTVREDLVRLGGGARSGGSGRGGTKAQRPFGNVHHRTAAVQPWQQSAAAAERRLSGG